MIQDRLRNKSVGIAGCGGLGSNCAVALARIGVGKLVIADFDDVSAGNLNRQYYFLDQVGLKKVQALKDNIARINPQVEVVACDLRLDPASVSEIFRECQVIVEAFDRAEMKRMLIETVLERMPGKFIVCGSGLAGYGNNNELRTRRVGNLFICGDERREVSDATPPLAPRVGIVAHMQANQTVEILLDHFA
jgi:sulfur carrier protein ThiS adenylyltransferase